MESILTSVKKLLGMTEEYAVFDTDLIMHINSVLMILRQMGVGPQEGFGISDATATWSEFCQNRADIEAVKSYTALKVKMLCPAAEFQHDGSDQKPYQRTGMAAVCRVRQGGETMRMLKFAVEGQQLAKRGDFAGVTAGSKGYLRCHFEQSDPEWLMAKKIAVFNDEYAVTVSVEGECAVPDEGTDGKSFKVYLAGQNGKTRMITNKVLIEQVK